MIHLAKHNCCNVYISIYLPIFTFIILLLYIKNFVAFDDDTMASTSQDSSFGDESTQDQDPLAIESKVSICYSSNVNF